VGQGEKLALSGERIWGGDVAGVRECSSGWRACGCGRECPNKQPVNGRWMQIDGRVGDLGNADSVMPTGPRRHSKATLEIFAWRTKHFMPSHSACGGMAIVLVRNKGQIHSHLCSRRSKPVQPVQMDRRRQSTKQESSRLAAQSQLTNHRRPLQGC
jgi:hypothetical protein